DAPEVVIPEHASERLLNSAVGIEEYDHRLSPDVSPHEVRASVVVREHVQVVPIQIVRYFGVRQDLLFEVLAPVAPDSADEQEDRLALPLRGIEYRWGMLHEPYLGGLVGVRPDIRREEQSIVPQAKTCSNRCLDKALMSTQSLCRFICRGGSMRSV